MIEPLEHPPLGSQNILPDRHASLEGGSSESEQDSYEWNLVRCKNQQRFHLIEVGNSLRTIRDRELFKGE